MDLQNMIGHWIIDGHDAWNEYRCIVWSSSLMDALLFPERKEPFSHDWKDENGIEVDLSQPRFKVKTATMKIVFVCDSEADYASRRNALFALFSAPGERTMSYRALNMSFNAYYQKSTSAFIFSKELNYGKVIRGMTVQLVITSV